MCSTRVCVWRSHQQESLQLKDVVVRGPDYWYGDAEDGGAGELGDVIETAAWQGTPETAFKVSDSFFLWLSGCEPTAASTCDCWQAHTTLLWLSTCEQLPPACMQSTARAHVLLYVVL